MSDTATPDLAALKKAYRKATHISDDYQYAEEGLQHALKYLDLAGYNTTVLTLQLANMQVSRDAAREARKAAAKAYYAARDAEKVQEGLSQSAAGEVESLGSFAQYVDEA